MDDKKDYINPSIETEDVELEDIIALSNDDINIFDMSDETFPGGNA